VAQAKVERDNLLREARDIKDKIINEAKEQAKIEANKIIDSAKADIENQKALAINQIKQQVVELSVGIAEKVLRRQFADSSAQKQFASEALGDVSFK